MEREGLKAEIPGPRRTRSVEFAAIGITGLPDRGVTRTCFHQLTAIYMVGGNQKATNAVSVSCFSGAKLLAPNRSSNTVFSQRQIDMYRTWIYLYVIQGILG